MSFKGGTGSFAAVLVIILSVLAYLVVRLVLGLALIAPGDAERAYAALRILYGPVAFAIGYLAKGLVDDLGSTSDRLGGDRASGSGDA